MKEKMILALESSENGLKCLRNCTFRDVQFPELRLSPLVGEKFRIEHCRFLNCSTTPGTCVIRNGVSLIDVEFSDLECGDAIRISSGVELDRVVICGDAPKTLVIQPDGNENWMPLTDGFCDFRLDISNFHGEVCIVGLAEGEVRRSSDRQVVVAASWDDSVPWKSLGIPPFSYWRLFCRKLKEFRAEYGVFSLPPRSDRNYSETMRERHSLIGIGLSIE